jgi:hypothetical protein
MSDDAWEQWLASDPACWSWPAPEAGQTVDDWHTELCAICGDPSETVDHCHRSGLVRGHLCRSCNRREGRHAGGIYRRYRERPPAVIVGHTYPYDDTNWMDGEALGWVVDQLGPVPADPTEAARYLESAATLRMRREDNPLRKMGL